MFVRLAAGVACCILAGLALLHVYWAFGGPAGKLAAIPTLREKPMLHPGPASTIAVALILFAMAATVAARAGWVRPMANVSRWAAWLVALAFGLRAMGEFHYVGFFKTVTDSRFARLDTLVYSPLCLLLAALIACVAALGR
jgi:hypothetical protein